MKETRRLCKDQSVVRLEIESIEVFRKSCQSSDFLVVFIGEQYRISFCALIQMDAE